MKVNNHDDWKKPKSRSNILYFFLYITVTYPTPTIRLDSVTTIVSYVVRFVL